MSDEITEPTVHLCWNDFAIRGAVHALRMANLDTMADDMETQLKPAVEEPKAFGSIVRAGYDEHTDRVLWVRAGRGWFAETEHGFHSSFAGLHDPEVLRVGIGEPTITDEEIDESQATAQKNIQVWRSITGRTIRFCTLRQDCRMSDGHDGECKP